MKAKLISSALLHEKGRRLDCGPYMSGAPEAKLALAKLRATKVPLASVTRRGSGIFNGGRFARTYVTESRDGVPFLGSTDILMGDLSGVTHIAASQAARDPGQLLEPYWSLITRSGTIGRMAFSRPDMRGMMASEHVLRVAADPEKIPPGYLHAYLRSKFGVPLIVSGTYGAIIQHIEPHHIAGLPVPRLSKSVEGRASELVVESANLLAKFQATVNSATKQLFEAVGLEDITAADWHLMGRDLGFFEATPSSVTLRSLNFAPRFKKLIAKIRATSFRTLGELCRDGILRRGGRYRRVDTDPGIGVQMIGQRDIFWVRPDGRWISRKHLAPDVTVPEGTTLIAGAGTFGESELYSRAEYIQGVAADRAYSELFVRALPGRAMSSGALFAFLRSETAFRMLRSISFGTKLNYPHPVLLRELPIPYPDSGIRDEVHRMIVDAYSARHRSVALEDQAIALVEDAIEKGATN